MYSTVIDTLLFICLNFRVPIIMHTNSYIILQNVVNCNRYITYFMFKCSITSIHLHKKHKTTDGMYCMKYGQNNNYNS